MKILLTGGTGFLGTASLRFLTSLPNRSDFDVTVVSSGRTSLTKLFNDHVKYLHLDLTDLSSTDTFSNLKFDTVVHLATSSTLGPKYSELQRYRDINSIDSTVLDIVKKVEANHLIWASSGAVYGKIETSDQSREANSLILGNLSNESAYRVGKIQSEYHVAKFVVENDVKLDILRLFTFSGIDLPLDVHFALGNFIKDALTENCINIAGSGLAVRSYLDQNDFADIIQRILHHAPSNIRILNIGSPNELTLKKVANTVQDVCCEIFGEKPKLQVHNKFDDKDNYYIPNTDQLVQTFPDITFTKLSTSVREMLIHAKQTRKLN